MPKRWNDLGRRCRLREPVSAAIRVSTLASRPEIRVSVLPKRTDPLRLRNGVTSGGSTRHLSQVTPFASRRSTATSTELTTPELDRPLLNHRLPDRSASVGV